jgi:hypothetical protein
MYNILHCSTYTYFQTNANRLVLLQRCPEVPVVEIAAADTKISSEAEPAQVRRKQPSADGVDLTPNVGQVANGTAKSKDIDGCGNWSAHGKVKRSPNQVQGELDAVEGGALLGECDSLRVHGSGTSRPSTVGSVAHGGV